jgi:Tfp pilus assembly protein FimV
MMLEMKQCRGRCRAQAKPSQACEAKPQAVPNQSKAKSSQAKPSQVNPTQATSQTKSQAKPQAKIQAKLQATREVVYIVLCTVGLSCCCTDLAHHLNLPSSQYRASSQIGD